MTRVARFLRTYAVIGVKAQLAAALRTAGWDVTDFGAHELVTGDDYPDFVVPPAKAVASGLCSWLRPIG